jgi:hypothetical protein
MRPARCLRRCWISAARSPAGSHRPFPREQSDNRKGTRPSTREDGSRFRDREAEE